MVDQKKICRICTRNYEPSTGRAIDGSDPILMTSNRNFGHFLVDIPQNDPFIITTGNHHFGRVKNSYRANRSVVSDNERLNNGASEMKKL